MERPPLVNVPRPMPRIARLFLAALLMCAAGPGAGVAAARTPAVAKVGVYLLNITDFDPRNGMFGTDFHLHLVNALVVIRAR